MSNTRLVHTPTSVRSRADSEESVRSRNDSTDADNIRPAWEEDNAREECFECNSTFGVWTRKHHCRFCGHLVCGSCSSTHVIAPVLSGHDKPLRTCTYCLGQLAVRKQGTRIVSRCTEWPMPHIHPSEIANIIVSEDADMPIKKDKIRPPPAPPLPSLITYEQALSFLSLAISIALIAKNDLLEWLCGIGLLLLSVYMFISSSLHRKVINNKTTNDDLISLSNQANLFRHIYSTVGVSLLSTSFILYVIPYERLQTILVTVHLSYYLFVFTLEDKVQRFHEISYFMTNILYLPYVSYKLAGNSTELKKALEIEGLLRAALPYGSDMLGTLHYLLPHLEKISNNLSVIAPHVPTLMKHKDKLMPEIDLMMLYIEDMVPYMDELMDRMDILIPFLGDLLLEFDILAPHLGGIVESMDEMLPHMERLIEWMYVLGPHMATVMAHKQKLLPNMKLILNNMHYMAPYMDEIMANIDVIEDYIPIITVYMPQLHPYMRPMLKHAALLMPFVDHPQFPTMLPYLPVMMPKIDELAPHIPMMLPALDRLFPYLGVFMTNLDTFLPYMEETLPNVNTLLYHLSWSLNDSTKHLLKYKIVAASMAKVGHILPSSPADIEAPKAAKKRNSYSGLPPISPSPDKNNNNNNNNANNNANVKNQAEYVRVEGLPPKAEKEQAKGGEGK